MKRGMSGALTVVFVSMVAALGGCDTKTGALHAVIISNAAVIVGAQWQVAAGA